MSITEELTGNRNPATRSGAPAEGGDHEKRRFFGSGGRDPSRDDKGKNLAEKRFRTDSERLASAERFEPRSVLWCLRILGVAFVADVAFEIAVGVWDVHAGRLYPWRHIDVVPLYSPTILVLEWTVRACAGLGLALFANRKRIVAASVRAAAVALFAALLQRYSNHGVLLFLLASFLSFSPPDVVDPAFAQRRHPALGLVRAQLVIVYVFSGINKIAHGFGRGESLANLLDMAPGPARAASWAVIALELALPVVLALRPRVGVILVIAMHAAFAMLLPGVLSFGLGMVAMSVLFLRRRN